MFVSADDRGFCDNTELIIDILDQEQIVKTGLLEDDYKVALNELVDKALLYRFTGKHSNSVYLIRHWFYHNKYKEHLFTNHYKYLRKVVLIDNKYEWKPKKEEETIFKENNKLNEDKVNYGKVNDIKLNENEITGEKNNSVPVVEEEDNGLPFEYDYKKGGK